MTLLGFLLIAMSITGRVALNQGRGGTNMESWHLGSNNSYQTASQSIRMEHHRTFKLEGGGIFSLTSISMQITLWKGTGRFPAVQVIRSPYSPQFGTAGLEEKRSSPCKLPINNNCDMFVFQRMIRILKSRTQSLFNMEVIYGIGHQLIDRDANAQRLQMCSVKSRPRENSND